MSEDYGRHRLAGLALGQIEQAENDPRRADAVGLRDAFYAATGEAENLRFLAELGLRKVSAQPVDHQAKWEQAYMAQLMIDGDFAYVNGMTLVAIYSAVDAMIESMVPSRVEAIIALQALAILDQLGSELDSAEAERLFKSAMASVQMSEALAKLVKKAGRVGSGGLSRYERHLQVAGLANFPDREFPDDLDVALKEIGALRDVVVHGGAKVDAKAVAKAPTLPERGYAEGSFVRIGRTDYRTYSAALYTFAEEVLDRMLLQVGQRRPNHLAAWRDNATLNA
ncbi:MAG: hypothetical protein JWQ18_91 [Conexibacter sp.]|nr:hypothetical protein [Conexibacter sp.]